MRRRWLTNDKRHAHIRVLLDDSIDGVNVVVVVLKTIVRDRVLAIRGKGSAVTVGQVVDDESAHDWRVGTSGVLRLDVGEVGVHGGDLGESVAAEDVSIVCKDEQATSTHSHTKVPTLATALAAGARLAGRDGIAMELISDA